MSKQYNCNLCKKVFSQKIDFTRHQNKKAPCISLTEMEKLTQIKEIKTDNKTTLITVFKSCLNILRGNSEGLTGDKALRNMSYLLILKLIEKHISSGLIDIDNYQYDFSHIEDDMIENHKKKLLEIVRFSNLANEKEDNIQINMKYLWDDVLSNHPTTKNIFLKGKGFDIQHKTTYKKLIDKLNSLDLSNCEYDVLGNAYEEVIQDIMTGKVLGQFFTPPPVKKMMVKLIDPQIHPDGKIDTCGDPSMGTGGFLITYLMYILQQAEVKNIKPDWNFIKTEGLYGKELEPDTYQMAVSNMLITSGHIFENLDRGDSILNPITRKFDNILANPPFGDKIKIKHDDIQGPLKEEYAPIKTDNAVSLFIQAIICMLKINGKCAVVLPDGQDLFSKNNATLVAVREYLMKSCDLKEIIYLPSGIFTYTTIKTCVFYFVKKREGTDVLDTKIKISKTQKEVGRDYNFSTLHQTNIVKFYEYNPYEDVKNLLTEVSIDKIANNSYSLNYTEYMKEEIEEQVYEDDTIIVKTIGEICEFLPKSKRSAKYGNKKGLYPFFKSSNKIDSYVDIPDYEEESLIIGDGGEPNINYGIKFSTSDHCYILQNTNKSLFNLKYIYYYLYHNLDIMKHLYTGLAIKNISKTNIEGIKIPIPNYNCQEEIVNYLDFVYEKTNKTTNTKIIELNMLNESYLNNQKKFGNNVIKTLGEVCNFKNGKGIKKDTLVEGEYPVIGGGQKPMGFHNEYNNHENTILCSSSGAYAGFISKYNKKVWASDCFSIISNTNTINNDYLYYMLKNVQTKIYTLQTGTAQPHIYSKDLFDLKIVIPSIERQIEIVEYCKYNETLITQLEMEIERNKREAMLFISGIVKHKNID